MVLTPDTVYSPVPNDQQGQYILIDQKLHSGKEVINSVKDPAKFRLSGFDYASDGSNIYFRLKPVKHANPNTFKTINEYFAKDQHSVFYQGSILEGENPDSFSPKTYQHKILDIYTINDDIVRYIKPSQLKTIENSPYKTDGTYVYHASRQLPMVDLESFSVIAKNYAKDNKYVYCNADIIKGADVDSFALLSDFLSIDNQSVYYFDKALLHAQPKTFRRLEGDFSRDSSRLYWQNLLVEGVDPADYIYRQGDWARELRPGVGELVRDTR